MKKLHLLSILIFIFTTSILSASVDIQTELIPEQLAVNQAGTYKISFIGDSVRTVPEPPQIQGLKIRYIGEQTSFQYINGNSFHQTDYLFSVVPTAPGSYTIPSFNITIKNKPYTVPATTFTVTEKPQSTISSSSRPEFELQIAIDKTKVFLGEMVPIKITLFVPLRNNIMGVATAPSKESDAFLDSGFHDKPTQSTGTLNGKPVHTLSWESHITPLKTGEQSLQFKLQVVTSTPYTEPYSSLETLMKQSFGTLLRDRITEVAHDVYSPKIDLSVEPLPLMKDSTEFSGAIGNFKLEASSINPNNVAIGDPIALQYTISGSGNFERLIAPTLTNIPGWKVYPPKASFTPSDPSGFSGKKTFEYVLIPQNDSLTQTPSFSFDIFNPEQAAFENITIPSFPITLIAAPTIPNAPPPPPTPSEQPPVSGNHPTPLYKKTLQSIKSFFSTPWAYAFTAIPLVLISSFYISKKRKNQKKMDTPANRQKAFESAIKLHLRDLHNAYSKKNTERFYTSFQKIISTIASKSESHLQHSLTFPEIEKLLSHKNIPQRTLEKLQELHHKIDLIKFGGHTYQPLTRKDFQEVDFLVKNLLSSL